MKFDFEDDNYVNKWTRDPELYWYEKTVVDKFFDKTGTILVVGCGTGRDSVPLARMGYDVSALDISRKMVYTGRKLYRHEKKIHFCAGSGTRLPFADESFNHCILSCQTINLIDDLHAGITEGHRVLKDGGIFTFTMHNPCSINALLLRDQMLNFRLYSPIKMERELRVSGFKEITINSLRTFNKPTSLLSKYPFVLFHHLLIYVCRK